MQELTDRQDAIRRVADASASAIRERYDDPARRIREAPYFAEQAVLLLERDESIQVDLERMQDEIEERLR